MGQWRGAAVRAVAVVALVSALVPAAPAAFGRVQVGEEDDCFGFEPTITGTSGDDVIEGTRGFDIIAALGGNDSVAGGRGMDLICAGDGDDRVHGGPGIDVLEGLRGADELFGDGDDDLLFETSLPEDPQGPVWVHAGDSSDDEFHGGPGRDLLGDDGANDLLDGGDGPDTFLGLFTFSPTVIDLANGHTSSLRGDVNTLVSVENAIGGIYRDVILGSEGPNVLSGAIGGDFVYGEGSADLLLSTTSGALLDGGGGRSRDGLLVLNDDGTDVDLENGTVSPRGGAGAADRILGIEDVIAGEGDDVVVGNDVMNRLYGSSGDDVLDGAAENDLVVGDAPFWPWTDTGHWDVVDPGGRGDDTLIGGDGRDRLDGGPARDECRSGEVVRRCEVVVGDRAAARAGARGGGGSSLGRGTAAARGLDTWWFPLMLDLSARPWLDLVPTRLRR
ncbi:MAG: calcium-binding protein [Actinomycetota bacterium]